MSTLRNEDPRKEGYKNIIELGYTIVIPQEFGHAIIAACEHSDQTLIKDIAHIHRCIPFDVKSNELYIATKQTKKLMSNWVWGFNELGIKASTYENWDRNVQKRVNEWLREEKKKKSVWLDKLNPSHLPLLF